MKNGANFTVGYNALFDLIGFYDVLYYFPDIFSWDYNSYWFEFTLITKGPGFYPTTRWVHSTIILHYTINIPCKSPRTSIGCAEDGKMFNEFNK